MGEMAKLEVAKDLAVHGAATLPPMGEVQQALALVRESMGQLSAEVEAEARELAGPELRLQQALALPRRAATLRDLSIALRELIISMERQQLGLDDGSRLLKAYAAMNACAGPFPATKEAGADGQ